VLTVSFPLRRKPSLTEERSRTSNFACHSPPSVPAVCASQQASRSGQGTLPRCAFSRRASR